MEWLATAKVNLFLSVLDRRPDGYHNVETVYQSVALADRLHFEAAGGEIALKCVGADLPTGRENLVVRAAALMQSRFRRRVPGLRIVLEKRIPVGSGLGGGSADAAVTLKACNEMFRLGLTAEQLRGLAAEIGMDVPFLIEGGRAIGRDRGERLEALPMPEPGWAVIVAPAIAVSTRWAYEQIDPDGSGQVPSVDAFVERLRVEPLTGWVKACFNAFEAVVFRAHPQLKALKEQLRELGCAGAFLSGSGAAVVGLTDDPERAAWVVENLAGPFQIVEVAAFCAQAGTMAAG